MLRRVRGGEEIVVAKDVVKFKRPHSEIRWLLGKAACQKSKIFCWKQSHSKTYGGTPANTDLVASARLKSVEKIVVLRPARVLFAWERDLELGM